MFDSMSTKTLQDLLEIVEKQIADNEIQKAFLKVELKNRGVIKSLG